MGFKLPKIKIKAPKIKINPTKLITNAISGVTNTVTSTTGAVLGGVGAIAGQAVGTVGGVMSEPGAGAVLGLAGAAFGVPGIGAIAGALAPPSVINQSPVAPPVSETYQAAQPTYISQPNPIQKDNTILYASIGGGVLLLILGALFFLKKGK